METQTALTLKKQLSHMQYLVIYFFTYAILGWIIETVFAFGVLGGFNKRGFLFGPLCPIYGFGAIIMILFISQYKDNSINRLGNLISKNRFGKEIKI